MNKFEELQAKVEEITKDAGKAYAGNKSAITRLRVGMQAVKVLAQDVRNEVQALVAG